MSQALATFSVGGRCPFSMRDRLYERMSDPMLLAELRHLRGELEKLSARGEAAVKELDKRLTARNGQVQPTGSDVA
jgi:hypothetical protein